jgi:hypothetical protein
VRVHPTGQKIFRCGRILRVPQNFWLVEVCVREFFRGWLFRGTDAVCQGGFGREAVAPGMSAIGYWVAIPRS